MMPLDLTLNRAGRQSLYRQIAEQIRQRIGDGRLPANTRLPPVRHLAQELGVTRLTIQNAYGELQADGWVEATVGRGTFVSSAVQTMSLQPNIGQYLTPHSAINDMLAINQVVGVRSMAMAHADSSLFPVDELWTHLERLRPRAHVLLGYGPLQGDMELRLVLSEMLREDGITAVPEDILITSGAMQGLALATGALARPGDNILIDQPTYLGILNIVQAQGVHPIHAPLAPNGPDTAVLENLIRQHRPRFYYTIPNYHNPTGVCQTLAQRQAILQLAQTHDLMIVEDDIYGKLGYGEPAPTLKSLDTDDRVLYLSSFSKMLMPGLRIGYLLTPPALRAQLHALRCATDLCGNDLWQRALAHFVRDGGLKRHLRRVLPVYRERRDALLAALDRHMPAPVQWTQPEGGFSCWLTLPRCFARGELYQIALQNGFAFTPGEAFLLESPAHEQLRLCFGGLNPDGIHAGIRLLSDLIRERLAQGRRAVDWIPVV